MFSGFTLFWGGIFREKMLLLSKDFSDGLQLRSERSIIAQKVKLDGVAGGPQPQLRALVGDDGALQGVHNLPGGGKNGFRRHRRRITEIQTPQPLRQVSRLAPVPACRL